MKVELAELRSLRDRAVESWQDETFEVTRRIDRFAASLGAALGEISRDEAIDALKKMAVDEIEKLRCTKGSPDVSR